MKHTIKLNIDSFFNLDDSKDQKQEKEEIVVIQKQKFDLKYFKSILTKKQQQVININNVVDVNCFDDELLGNFVYGISYDDETQL